MVVDQIYDGFISYSHAADGLLAPRLQAGLQRFAKPWWKRRAVRVFRDESSLSANPHLWSSITDALETSGWFVLLLSPDAASSEWVNQEIAYWKTHRDPSRILPVVTDGEFGWSSGDVTGNAVPEELRGVFSEEPRWVDLRFAKDEEQLDLKNPRFSAAVADIASALRGVPKDELESEEVRQHRRTLRTAWAAGTLVLLLGIVAVFAALEASTNAAEAERQAEIAAASAEAEAEARREAEANAEAEATARIEAQRQSAIAKSRELSASAVAVLDEDPELATMLAIESIEATPQGSAQSLEAARTLRLAVLANRLQDRFDDIGNYARISPDGTTMYHSQADSRTVHAVDIESGRQVWSSEPLLAGTVGRVEVSPDGAMVSLQVHHPNDQEVFILDPSSGEVTTSFHPSEGCSGLDSEGLSAIGGFSPGGQWFSIFTGRHQCGEEPGEGWVAVYATSTWEEVARLSTEDGSASSAEFSADGARVLVSGAGPSTAELRSFPELGLIRSYENALTVIALSPDGQRIAYLDGLRGPILAETETAEIISSLGQASEAFFSVEPLVFSPDGLRLLVASRGRDYVFDGMNGQFLGTLGGNGSTVSGSFTADGTRLLTTTAGDALIWGFTTGQAIGDATFSGDWVNQEQATDGPFVAVNVIAFEGNPVVVTVLDPDSDKVVASKSGFGGQLADGRFALVPWERTGDVDEVGPLQIWDPRDDTTTLLAGCTDRFQKDDIPDESGASCPDDLPFFGGSFFGDPFAVVSDPGGSTFAARSRGTSSVVVTWDQTTLARISEFQIPRSQMLVGMSETLIVAHGKSEGGDFGDGLSIYDIQGAPIAHIDSQPGVPYVGSVLFNANGSLLIARDASGVVSIHDTQSWELVLTWGAHEGLIRGWGVSKDGERLATTGEDGFVRIWDISSVRSGEPPSAPELTIPFPVHRISDVLWMSDDRLVVFFVDRGTGARWSMAYLDTGDLIRDARTRLTRGFTEIECNTYQIEDCPRTREDIRTG